MKRGKWQRVTNELVCSFAVAGCANCEGRGYVGDDAQGRAVCSCATLAFRREYGERVRPRRQRIGKHDVTWLEFRPLAAVAA